MNGWHIGTLVCAFISLLLLIIALATDYWVDFTIFAAMHNGLWIVCKDGRCAPLGMNVSGAIHATRAFLLIGMFIGAFSCVMLCAMFITSQIGSFSLGKNAMITSFVAGICALIAMATFAGAVKAAGFYAWSFSLGWVSCILFFITGGLAYRLARETTA